MNFQTTTCPFDLERLQREVNILLVSDLHYDINKEKKSRVSGVAMNSELLKGIEELGNEWAPDIVIVAGDLVNTNQPEGYPHLRDLLEKLTTRYPNLRHTIFFSPGNHDVDRKKQKEVRKILSELSGKCFPSCSENFMCEGAKRKQRKKIANALNTIAKIPITDRERKLFSQYEKTYFQLYLDQQEGFRTLPTGTSLLAPTKLTPVMDGIDTVYLKSSLGVTIVSHNSSFFCNIGNDRDDRNFLFLIKEFVETINKMIPVDGPIISFMHHPFYLLNDSEHIGPATMGPGGDKNNNFTKILDQSDLILSGHVHGILHDPTFLLNKAHMITNGTSFTTDNYINKFHPYTFGMIKVNKQLRKFALKKRRYRTTDEPGIIHNGFQSEDNDKLEYFHFGVRKGIEPTSIEAERVRILHYFASLNPNQDVELEYRFLFYQLVLLNDGYRTKDEINCEIEEFQDKDTHTDVILIKATGRRTLYIYKMPESDNYIDRISSILQMEKSKQVPAGAQIYFSVPRKAFVDSNGVPFVKRIEALQKDFSDIALLSKREYVSIDLLYY